jgi:hypothetical protein
VLVGDEVVLVAQVPLIARPQHGLGQRGHLLGDHAVDGDGHQQRRHLVVGDRPAREAFDEELDLARLERPAAALLVEELVNAVIGHRRKILWRTMNAER